MGKKLRIAALVGCGLVLVVAVGFFALYKGLKHEPQFYREALAVDPAAQKQTSDEMLRRATALRNDVQRGGPWHALFTAEQINGWLAVDLAENYPDALPETLSDPRVAIRPDRIMLACRLRQAYGSSVVSLTVEPYLPEPNLLALRIRQARAGALPAPLGKILDGISQAAAQAQLRVHWQQADGDPVVFLP
ncbi:MAG: hypothetical protein A2V70_03470, partial [Planctomycetes bacterium RBG_13_63_9]